MTKEEAIYILRNTAWLGGNEQVQRVEEAIDTLERLIPNWIPVSERLPEPDERVLVYTVGKEFHVWDAMPHRSERYAWEDEEGLCHSLYEVDLWIPFTGMV